MLALKIVASVLLSLATLCYAMPVPEPGTGVSKPTNSNPDTPDADTAANLPVGL